MLASFSGEVRRSNPIFASLTLRQRRRWPPAGALSFPRSARGGFDGVRLLITAERPLRVRVLRPAIAVRETVDVAVLWPVARSIAVERGRGKNPRCPTTLRPSDGEEEDGRTVKREGDRGEDGLLRGPRVREGKWTGVVPVEWESEGEHRKPRPQ
jgi:hypothetical protein